MVNRIKTRAIGLTLLAVLILTACGQKRALYLPEEPSSNKANQESGVLTEPTEQGKD